MIGLDSLEVILYNMKYTALNNQYHIAPRLYGAKSIIDLSTCIMATAHVCSKSLGSANRSFHVSSDIASSHHYKECESARQSMFQNCSKITSRVEKDARIEHFRNSLVELVEARHRQLFNSE